MSKLVSIIRSDGGVSIMEMTDDKASIPEAVTKWSAVSGRSAVKFREITRGDLPEFGSFRNALADSGAGKLHIDMVGARAIKMYQIREARNAELAKTDTPMVLTMEKGDDAGKAELATRRQALRDLPAKINLNAIKTLGDLEAYEPDELKGQ